MLPDLLQAPDRPNNVSKHAHWLAGEGAGSWFEIELKEAYFSVSRYSDQGILECQGLFRTDTSFDISKPYEVTFPSHCAKVTVIQNDERFTLLKAD